MPRALLFLFLAVSLSAQESFAQREPTVMITSSDSLDSAQMENLALATLSRMNPSLKSVAPIHAKGTSTEDASGKSSAIEVIAIGPRTFRTITTSSTGTYEYIVDDGDGVISLNGKRKRLGWETLFGERCPYFPLFSFLAELEKKSLQLDEALPKASGVSIKAHYEDPTDPEMAGLSKAELTTDVSGLPSTLTYTVYHAQNAQISAQVEYTYSDYREVDGVLLPFAIDVKVDGQPSSKIRFTSVTFDPNLTLGAEVRRW